MNSNIALFYGSSTCYTEFVGEKIAACLGEGTVDIFNVDTEPLSTCLTYRNIIFGIPTWDYGELQEDWENIWPELDALKLHHKTVALYGVGDQLGYPDWFLDAMGYLHDRIIQCGATVVGPWPIEGYTFTESQALTQDKTHFVGLAIDEENQHRLTEQRIAAWCDIIKSGFS